METNRAVNQFNFNTNLYAENQREISLLNDFIVCELKDNNCECCENYQCRLCSYGSRLNPNNKQSDFWYLSENKMFQHPRRRKFYEKRLQQGQINVGKMPFAWDISRNMDTIDVQTPFIMLKSTESSHTMW